MSTPSQRPQPRVASGRYTFAQHDPAETGLLSREEATEEARQVFTDAKARAAQATVHARRAGVNLLASLALAHDARSANLALRWEDGRYTAESIHDHAGGVLWAAANADAGDPINRTITEVGAYIDEPGDAADAGVRVLTDGEAVLPLTPSERFTLADDIDRLIG